ncbi:MAG: fibronectin type III domain-containing protein, partial [Bacteroidales bacterium]
QGNRNPFIDQPEFANLIWGIELDPEPENHITDFSANSITLSWADAVAPILPDGYLVRMSDKGFYDIAIPVDGQQIYNDFYNKNVPYGQQSVTFDGLFPNTLYYFKIFSYKGEGASIDFKTEGIIPNLSIMTN